MTRSDEFHVGASPLPDVAAGAAEIAILPHTMQQAQFGSMGNWADRMEATQDARIENQRQGIT